MEGGWLLLDASSIKNRYFFGLDYIQLRSSFIETSDFNKQTSLSSLSAILQILKRMFLFLYYCLIAIDRIVLYVVS